MLIPENKHKVAFYKLNRLYLGIYTIYSFISYICIYINVATVNEQGSHEFESQHVKVYRRVRETDNFQKQNCDLSMNIHF